jgi:fatty-acid desaturase
MTEAMPIAADAAAPSVARLPLPSGVASRRIAPVPATFLVSYHLLALLAFVPWFFSWSGLAVAVIASIASGALGIALCYHRLLAHRSFRVPKRLEHALAIIGVCCVQDTPARWVAVHRRHHEHADEQPDPHSPWVSFFWAHIGWIVVENDELSRLGIYERYARDLLRDPFYKRLERGYTELLIILASWAAFFLLGAGVGWLTDGTMLGALQSGASFLVWGVFVRTVFVWHQTWAVNSVSHLWGYRNYATNERSRNNVWVGLFSNGEGWHNNHHAYPRSANNGHRPGEIDTTYWIVRGLAAAGLASDVNLPKLDEERDTAVPAE